MRNINTNFNNNLSSTVEYLAIVSNDESGIFQVMSFDTEDELNKYAETVMDGLNYVIKYKAFKLN